VLALSLLISGPALINRYQVIDLIRLDFGSARHVNRSGWHVSLCSMWFVLRSGWTSQLETRRWDSTAGDFAYMFKPSSHGVATVVLTKLDSAPVDDTLPAIEEIAAPHT
jgi:hypothetical protein